MAYGIFQEVRRLNNKLKLLDLKYTLAKEAGRKLDCVKIVKQYRKIEKRANAAVAQAVHQKNLDWHTAIKENEEL